MKQQNYQGFFFLDHLTSVANLIDPLLADW